MGTNALTWRDTAAPNFQTSMEGIKVAGDQITSAGNALNKGLGDWETSSKNQATDLLYKAAAQYPDAASLKAAQADGSFYTKAGIDPTSGWITAEGLKGVDNRAGAILNQATTQIANNQSLAMNPKLLDEKDKTIRQTDLSNQLAAGTLQSNIGLKAADLTGKTQSNIKDKTEFDQSQEDRTENEAARLLAAKMARLGGNDSQASANLIANAGKDEDGDPITDGVRAKALALLPAIVRGYAGGGGPSGGAGGVEGGSGGTVGGKGGTTAPASNPNIGYSAPDDASAAVDRVMSTDSLGSYKARVRQIESSGNDGAISSTGAAGRYQFTKGTWEQYGNGGNRLNVADQEVAMDRLTAANQAVLTRGLGRAPTQGEMYLAHQQGAGGALALLKNPNARAGEVANPMFISVNGGNPNGTAGAFAQKWMSKFGDGGESSMRSYDHAQNSQASTLIGNQKVRADQNNAGGIQGNYEETQQNTKMQMGDAVAKLKLLFPGTPDDMARARINEVITESKKQKGSVPVTIATALALLDKNGAKEHHGIIGRVLNPMNWSGAERDGIDVDSATMTKDLTSIGKGTSQETVTDNAATSAIAQQVQTAKDAKDRARDELLALRETARNRTVDPSVIADKQAKYDRSQLYLQQLLDKHAPKKDAKGSAYGWMTPQFSH